MALNQNAHRRNLEALEYIKQQRAKQKKYNLTPGKAVQYAKTANNYANKLGSTLSELGEDTNNATIKNLGNKLYNNTGSNLGNKVYDFAKDKIAAFKNGADVASKASSMANTANNAGNVANTASNVSNVANNASNVANAANTASNASNMASAASNASNAASAASNASSAASGASSMASSGASGAPVVGTALGAISAGNNFAKGDNVNGALDAAKTGAAFIPVYGWIASAVISAVQMARNAFLKKKQEAHSKTQDAAAKATEESMLSANEKKQEIAQDRAEKQQELFADNPINGQLGEGGVAMPENLPTFSDMASEVVPKDENGDPQTISGQVQEMLPKETITKGIMDKVKGLFGQNQEEGQMTGGAAPVSTETNRSPYFLENTSLEPLSSTSKVGTLTSLPKKQNALSISDMLQDAIYEKQRAMNGDEYAERFKRTKHDWELGIDKNADIIKPLSEEEQIKYDNYLANQQNSTNGQPIQNEQPIKIGQNVQFTPEQQARYNEAMAIQEAGNQARRVPILEGYDTGEVLPPTPTAPATASPSRTNFDTSQFEIIEPDGTMHPAQQTQQAQQAQKPIWEGQVSTTQPAQPQQQFIPYEENQSKVADIMRRIRQGWDENTTERFNPTNITDKTYDALVQDKDGNVSKQEIAKNIWNRIGEGVGTGQKLLSNPLMQGLIAGAVYKATGGDGGESLKYGVDWAQNKAKSDYYQKQINPSAKPNILGGYTAEDWKTKESIERAKAQQKTAEANLKLKEEENRLRAEKLLLEIEKQNKKSGKDDDGFAETFRILRDREAPDRLEKLAQLLSDYSLVNPDVAKKLAEMHGIDLVIKGK